MPSFMVSDIPDAPHTGSDVSEEQDPESHSNF